MTLHKRYKMGERIRECRKQRHISQEQLAEAIDVSTNAISNIERGNNNATLENIQRIAKYFNVSLDYLTDGNKQTLEDEDFIQSYLKLSKEDRMKIAIVLNTFFPEVAKAK